MLQNLSSFLEKKSKKAVKKRAKWIFILLLILVLLLIIYFSYQLWRPWSSYQPALQAELAWQNFVNTFSTSCRESCLLERQSYADRWRLYYLQDLEWQSERCHWAFFETNNTELQKALIKIMAADYGQSNLPSCLESVIASEHSSLENKALIVQAFAPFFKDEHWLDLLRQQIQDIALSEQERGYALSLLAAFPDTDNALVIKEIILSSESNLLLDEAFKIIALWPSHLFAWSEADWDLLSQSLENYSDSALRWSRIWLLAEQDLGLAESRKKRLEAIAHNINLDAISRGLAADSLVLEFNIEIKTPMPNEREWQEFYEKL